MTEQINPKFLLSLTGLAPEDGSDLATPKNTKRGWSSAHLPIIYGDDGRFWTVNEAVKQLVNPTLSAAELRQLIRLHNMEPCGKKRTTKVGTSGRYARVYRAEDLIKLHDSLTIK